MFSYKRSSFSKKYPNLNFDYHEYRNMNYQNFLIAAEELTKRGYHVLEWVKFKRVYLR